ncbi:26279_t:CDS:1 [Gigaspora margarita]|uniref:26279_t:CDS:1 n=1 Tax=Gigaspora margarita TaxID=4874 RepID=A0ABM8W4P0_GIGMA|nr:26279_t:CDS:1 [Gigaspora margarita]
MDFFNSFCLATFLFVCYLIIDLTKTESTPEDKFICVIYYAEESVNKPNVSVNKTNITVNEPNGNNNFSKQLKVENSTFSFKEMNDYKWKKLNLKFTKMTREEKFDQRGLILYLEIIRLIEILKKIDPNLVNYWLQYFINSTGINDYNLRIEEFQSFIYDKLISIQKSSL